MGDFKIAGRCRHCVIVAVTSLALAGCEQLQSFELPFGGDRSGPDNGRANLASDPSSEGETRDVEAPEVFQKNESGLWDGRPSLGGIWVAHADVGDPERVLIRNEDNGRFVVGALFRRERDNPGPAFQVSSDAAEELGMLAGSPARLNVTALRREEIAPPTAPDFDTSDGADVATALAAPADIAATPLDAAPTVPDPEVEALALPDAPIDEAAVTTTPISNGASAAVTALAAAAIEAAEANPDVAATLPPLPDPNAPVSAIPLGAPLDARGPLADPVPLPEATGSALEKPFVQVGIFNVESSANDAATTLRGDGISASVVEQAASDTTFWRVLVGPSPNAQDRTAILAQIQALGFNDAYFVAN